MLKLRAPDGQNKSVDTSKRVKGMAPKGGGTVNKSRNRGTKGHTPNVSKTGGYKQYMKVPRYSMSKMTKGKKVGYYNAGTNPKPAQHHAKYAMDVKGR